MRDIYRRYLTTLGLGSAIAFLPHLPPAAAETSTAAPAAASTLNQAAAAASSMAAPTAVPTLAQTQPPSPDLLPRVDLEQMPDDSSAPLSPAEQPRPLETVPEPGPEAGPNDPSLPPEGSPTAPAMPSADSPAVPIDGAAPTYLDAQANPLLLPTQPEEVEIVGTQPISLEQAIELAYRNNQELQIALLQLERSQAALRQAQAALYPDVIVGASLEGQEGQSGSSITSTGEIVSGGSQLNAVLGADLEVSYDIYTGGRREASIRAAEERVRLSELDVERAQVQLRLDTTNDYYALQQSIESIRIAQAFLTEAERNLNDAALREEVGVGTRFEVLRAEVQVADARQDLVQAQSDRRTAQRSLARRLSLPPSLDVSTSPVDIAGNWPLSLEESIVLAFQNRAELEQQLVQRSISDQERQVALADTLPQVDLFASYSLQNNFSRSTGFSDSVRFGARVQWSLYDGGAAVASAEQRQRDLEIAESQFADTRDGIRLEVEQAYFNLVANQENISTAQLGVVSARDALELAQLRFDAGVGTQLEVLTSTRELTEAEGRLVNAILDYNRSRAALERAVSNLPEAGAAAEF